jgi:phosphatidylglycerol:prolipoprotein diacylglycerol transferase
MIGFVHRIDPVIAHVAGVPLYYYGLAYAAGIIGVYAWLRLRRRAMGYTHDEVVTFSLLFAIGVLLGGRLFAVFVYHGDYYARHPRNILSCWRGGMASHGVLLGGLLAICAFARCRGRSFLRLADEVVLPAAVFLALGRVGNFINGQIVGTPADVWWAVQFPDAEGLRHPVTLYEAAKNLALVPILLWVRRRWRPGRGVAAAHFVLWYGLLRIVTDLFRSHGAELFGIGRNQYFNAAMAIAGAALWAWLARRPQGPELDAPPQPAAATPTRPVTATPTPPRWTFAVKCAALSALILLSLTIRSAWTPEVLESRRAAENRPPGPPASTSPARPNPTRGQGAQTPSSGRTGRRLRLPKPPSRRERRQRRGRGPVAMACGWPAGHGSPFDRVPRWA